MGTAGVSNDFVMLIALMLLIVWLILMVMVMMMLVRMTRDGTCGESDALGTARPFPFHHR